MSETTRELIQLRDEHLKQEIVRLAKKRNVRVSVLLRQMLEREVALETAYTAALDEESLQEGKARARRLKILLAPFWEYLAEHGELPMVQGRSYGGEAAAARGEPPQPVEAEAEVDEYDLDEGIEGFAGGLSDD
jgi:hypothetical protein